MDSRADRYFKNIIARRDRRFDGRFFFGVKTTGIYCRPVCPAKPKPENIVVFKSQSEAEANGFRACLRCHPDLAPGSKFLDGTINTVSRALRIINDSPAEDLDVPSLAKTLGMTDRHLRRLFDEHLGASPIEIMVTQRLHLAKQLIRETRRPITEIAGAVGFQSIRRFNEAFRHRYHQSPSAFRASHDRGTADFLTLKIPVRAPYDWNAVLGYLRRHETFGVERVLEDSYQRFIPRGNKFGSVTVTKPAADHLNVRFADVPLSEIRFVLGRLRNLFDTDHNPVHLPTGFPSNGIRVPGAFDPFEIAVTVILSQQVTLVQAKAKLKDLVLRFGRRLGGKDSEVYEFPGPATLVNKEIELIGVTRVKGDAIRGLAKALRRGDFDFSVHLDFREAEKKLLALRGIGPWTASIIAMRCLGDADAFPIGDLVVRRALANQSVDHTQWISSRAYLAHCMWRDWAKGRKS